MPDTKISGLASATSIAGTELVPIVQGGVNRNATPQLLQTQVYTERTLDFQIALTDRNRDQHINSASPVVCTIPLNATVAFDVGDRMDFVRLGAGTATIDAVSGVTLNGVDGDSIAIDAQYVWVRLKKVGTDAWQCSLVEGRTYTPATHATSHQSGGSDPIKLDDLAAPDDNTDLDATTSAHGLLPKLGGGSTNFLRADGTWSAPPGGTPGGSSGQVQYNNAGTFDGLPLWRADANTLFQRNGTSAQSQFLGNIYTDASNYEAGYARWVGNTFEIGTEKAGTGSARPVSFKVNGVEAGSINTASIFSIVYLRISSTIEFTAGGPLYGYRHNYAGSSFTPYTIASTDYGRFYVGTSASGMEWTHRTGASSGTWLGAKVGSAMAGAYFRINAGAGQKIRLSAGATVSGGYVRSNTAHSFLLMIWDATESEWVAWQQGGTWTIDS